MKRVWRKGNFLALLVGMKTATATMITTVTLKQWTGSKLGKEYIKAVFCHSAYFTFMQSTSREMLSWMKFKLESRLLGEVSKTSYMPP